VDRSTSGGRVRGSVRSGLDAVEQLADPELVDKPLRDNRIIARRLEVEQMAVRYPNIGWPGTGTCSSPVNPGMVRSIARS